MTSSWRSFLVTGLVCSRLARSIPQPPLPALQLSSAQQSASKRGGLDERTFTLPLSKRMVRHSSPAGRSRHGKRDSEADVFNALTATTHKYAYTVAVMIGGNAFDLMLDSASWDCWVISSTGSYSTNTDGSSPTPLSAYTTQPLYVIPEKQKNGQAVSQGYSSGNWEGSVVTDELGIVGLPKTLPSFEFVAVSQLNAFGTGLDGYSGLFPLGIGNQTSGGGGANLGFGPVGALHAAGIISSTVVGVSISDANAGITFGGVDTAFLGLKTATSVPILPSGGYYSVLMGDVSFGPTALLSSANNANGEAILDLGSSMTWVPSVLHETLVKGIAGASKWTDLCTDATACLKATIDLYGGYVIPCSPKQGTDYLTITLAGTEFAFAYSTLLAGLTLSDLLGDVSQASLGETWCLPAFLPQDDTFWILGIPFLRNVYQTLDPVAGTLALTSLVDTSGTDTSTW